MITLNKAPQLYTTLNLAQFQVTSNRPTILTFSVSVLDAATNAVLAVQSYGTLPMFPLGVAFDLAPILASYVTNQIVDSLNILEPTPKILRAYKLVIQERYIDGTGNVVLGDSLTTGTYNVLNATLSRVHFSGVDYRELVAGAGLTTTKFLSKRPIVSNLLYNTKEFLSFVTAAAARVKLTFYKIGVGVVGTQYIAVGAAGAYRVNLSPAAIQIAYGSALLNAYGREFSTVFNSVFGTQRTLSDANYFTVQLVSTATDAALSEVRTYVLKAEDCKKKTLELLFDNNVGGFDSAIFYEPRQTVTSSKTTIQSNPFQYDSTGAYTDMANGIFNPGAAIVASSNTSAFSIVSEPLSDENARFYRAIYESESVYIKLSNGVLYPINIEQKSYNIGQRKYSTSNNRLELTFMADGLNFNL